MSASSNLPISGTRLWDSLMEMARIGGTAKGGCNRQTLTAEDGEGRKLLARWGEAIGLTVTTDRLGNMVLRREGRDPSRPAVAMGSHLDTQPTGGKFDGVLGVLAGLEVMRALDEAGIETEAPVVLVNWTNEEGARFSPPMMGSGAAMGIFTEQEILDKRDAGGARFGDALEAIGWKGEADPADLRKLGAYFELHIEQGPVLEREGMDMAIVTHALAQHWLEVTVRGADSHGGGQMQGRRDSLVAAAILMQAVEEIALAAGGDGRGTVGVVKVTPSSRNVVPSETWFSVDMRHGDPEALKGMADALKARGAEVAARRGVEVEVEDFWYSPHTPFAPELAERLREAARRRGYRHRDMATGIGHDAVYVAQKVPTGFVWVPCHGGISHNEEESITPEWAEAGASVLADAVLATAGVSRG
ncbi:allantoate amidohydrolase [Roseomonas mucosa]|uniref:Zn-dependent hydrolase n=1 Tax=Roseomonas mucosa TaxID=207340 RepID=A0A1S8D7N4_9PROT|nr:Zn-dependent hydrolase [Roseomonas mucosa]MDT8265878.1 Zn-dependent hydrolase [Roseomonas sp. DSM 102946]ONH84376.1 Zn-dependent hydrolase [Roseomonas mucosa]